MITFGAIMTLRLIEPPEDWDGSPEDAVKRGMVKAESSQHNLVVTTGTTLLASAIFENISAATFSPATMQNATGAIGSGSTAPAPSNTGLVTEMARALRSNVTYVTGPPSYTKYFFFYGKASAGGPTGTVRECGVFCDVTLPGLTGGTLLNRALVSPAIVKGATDVLTFEVDLQVTPS